jgi:hypothetical protein
MNRTLAAEWLSLAAAPTFALMAAFTATLGGGAHVGGGAHAGAGAHAAFCSAGSHAWALDGMVPMYVLMSIFHVAPWWRRAVIAESASAHGETNTPYGDRRIA